MATENSVRNSPEKSLISDPALLARHGLSLLLNNQVAESEELFKSNANSIQMSAGYAFVMFMDALMSYEEEKLVLALNYLRETEKKCAGDIGWMKTVKSKVFGNKATSTAERLETQIILADIQVCTAILTFLQQEFRGFLKGGWVLRKAWKIYQHTYVEIVTLYKQRFGNFNLPEPTDFEWIDTSTVDSKSRTSSTSSEVPEHEEEWTVPELNNPTSSKNVNRNGYVSISSPDRKPNIPHSQSTNFFSKTANFFPFNMKRSGSAHSSLTTKHATNTESNSSSFFSLFSPFTSQLSLLASTLNLISPSEENSKIDTLDSDTIARLMGAVCFGYGLLQLGLSLLPPSLHRVTTFFGFTSNRASGISNLMYARKGTDMRAPLATLALLWYHTIVRPFYAFDGTNLKAAIEAGSLLLEEGKAEYKKSALFLFFAGRIYRLDSNIPKALESFQAAAANSAQREIKYISLHEVGWCYLIQLDCVEAHKVFTKLKQTSRWSRNFYSYLVIICAGTFGKNEYKEVEDLREFYKNTSRSNQLDVFIQRRLKLFPPEDKLFVKIDRGYWKILVYELLYLWNALPSCNIYHLEHIIQDCNEVTSEPMPGLAKLIQGECFHILGAYENAINSLRQCVHQRTTSTSKDDIHISAYGEYTLGTLLIKNSVLKEEGKQMLQHCSNYKDYDFDSKLLVRINMALKNVS